MPDRNPNKQETGTGGVTRNGTGTAAGKHRVPAAE
jgi:hypothetical protein